jgi:O-antigen/teichoic acid export membrane protein
MSASDTSPAWAARPNAGSRAPLDEPDPDQLSGHVYRGLSWKLASQIATQGTRLVVGISLARLLTPHQFGLAAMALVLTAFIIPFSDMGLGAALVQRRTLGEKDRSTVFWASVAVGIILTLLGVIAAPFIADFYGNAAVAPLVAVLSASFVITSLGATHRSLLARAMNFKSLELRYMAGTVVGGAAAISLAVAGYGAWAFVGQELALGLISTALLWAVVPWRPRLQFSSASLRDLSGFGLRALGGAFFTNLSRNADNALVGRYVGASALGLYAFAYNLVLASVTRIVGPVEQVIFPALSRLQDEPRRLASSWIRANRLILATSGPVLTVVIVTAPDLVPLVFGNRWDRAVPIVQILCWAGFLQCLVALNDVVLKARNAVKTYLRFTAGSFAVNLLGFVIGLHWGMKGVAVSFAVSSTLLGVVYTALVLRGTEISAREVVRKFQGVALAVAGMAACCLLTWEALVRAESPAVVRLLASVEIAVAAYVWLLRWRAPEVLADLRGMFSRSSTTGVGGK